MPARLQPLWRLKEDLWQEFLALTAKNKRRTSADGHQTTRTLLLQKRDPNPKRSAFLSRLRYRIDTVFSQLTGRYAIKRVWAREMWHLASRLLRKVLSHTIAFLINHQMDNPLLQLSKLLI